MKRNILFSLFLLFSTVSFFAFPSAYLQAQGLTEERKAQLEKELKEIERQIEEQRKVLNSKQKERVSLERDVAIIDANIQKAKLSIRARDLNIKQLTGDISKKTQVIGDLSAKLNREKDSLSQILRKQNRIDSYSSVEVFLSSKDLSDFFQDTDSFDSIKVALQDSFDEIEETKGFTEREKSSLEDKRASEVSLRQIQELEKKKIEEQEAEKKRILTATKGQEAAYQKVLQTQEKTAAEIRAALFELRGSKAIPFGDAYRLALEASKKTGVRPALILGILAEETNLGENIGTGTWVNDMHPTRDVPVFKAIAAQLGLNPDTLPVSKKPWYGWGGAMGPSQFIASTWACYGGFVNSITDNCNNAGRKIATMDQFWQGPWVYKASEDKIRKLTGKNSTSNPWDPQDAIMATAVLMMDNGADNQTFQAERLAALRYFAGWGNASNPAYAFYGDDVMELAAKYQKQIDILNGV